MKTQNLPLYAEDKTGGRYVVIGWTEPAGQMPVPVVAPLDRHGQPGTPTGPLRYSVTAPERSPAPAEAMTEIIQRSDISAEDIERVRQRRTAPGPRDLFHQHRASCHGPIGELVCGHR